jgi:hypothetical protein
MNTADEMGNFSHLKSGIGRMDPSLSMESVIYLLDSLRVGIAIRVSFEDTPRTVCLVQG